MSDDIRALHRAWFDEVWNNRNDGMIDRLMTDRTIAHGLGEDGRDMIGRKDFRLFYERFRSAFPDIFIRVDDVLKEGDQTVVRFTATGTHQGHGLGLPPTGRSFKVTGIVWVRWENGLIAEGWNEFDVAGLLRQIGGAPKSPQVRP